MRTVKALRAQDIEQMNGPVVDGWLDTVSTRLTMYKLPGDPTATQLPHAQWIVYKNSGTGAVYLAVNDNGTIKKVQLL